jgi:hypothetical protein
MAFEQHREAVYSQDADAVFQAALRASAALGGTLVAQLPAKCHLEVKMPKVILGKTWGERTYVTFEVRAQDGQRLAVLDAYPLDAVERKLMFGARKGVTEGVSDLFMEHLGQELQAAAK